MDPKHSGISFVDGQINNSASYPQKQFYTPRTRSLFGISTYADDSSCRVYKGLSSSYGGDAYERQHLVTYRPVKMAPVMEKRPSSEEKVLSRNNYSTVLREKTPNNTVINYGGTWMCDLDRYHRKIKDQHVPYSSPDEHYKYQQCKTIGNDKEGFDRHLTERIRVRSESEPNDIRNLQEWSSYSSTNVERPVKYHKSNDNELHAYGRRLEKISPNSMSDPRRQSPSLSLYKQSPYVTGLRKGIRCKSPSILSSPKSGVARRCRTTSSSPNRLASISSTTFRKARSATPPFRGITPITSSVLEGRLSVANKVSQSSVFGKFEELDDTASEIDDDLEDNTENNAYANSSSDSEDGYGTGACLYHSETLPSSNFPLTEIVVPKTHTSPFVPSLFPHVPPYLAFSTHTEKGPPMPPEVQKVLKWRLTTVMPKVVRNVVCNSGFRLLKNTNDWMGIWGKHMKSPCFKAIRSYQKINHLPGSFKIGRKDACWKNLRKHMCKYGKKEFGFMPKTYIFPQDVKLLRKGWPKYTHNNVKWIVKPPASARGTGIKVINRWAQIPKRRAVIVQKYIEKPLLINGSKFDLRLYVLVTSINPLRVYLYHDGLARFAAVKYSNSDDTLSDRCMHLTNYSINKFSSNYHKNEDVNACDGHKWTLKSLWSYLANRGVNTNRLWAALKNLVLKTILAGESSIYSMVKLNVGTKYNCYELFGFDVLLDSELIPWLLEVNISPSLHSDMPLDIHVKAPLVQAVLNTALYQVPLKLTKEQQSDVLINTGLNGPLCYDKRIYVSYLSRSEKQKHNQFTRKDLEDRDGYLNAILEDLTPDDVRCLIVSEDELARSSPLERIFPTQSTYKYLKYTECPRYYNRLLDAWEQKYGKKRESGIELLRQLCEKKYHLKVPASPMNRASNVKGKISGNKIGMVSSSKNELNQTKKSQITNTTIKQFKKPVFRFTTKSTNISKSTLKIRQSSNRSEVSTASKTDLKVFRII